MLDTRQQLTDEIYEQIKEPLARANNRDDVIVRLSRLVDNYGGRLVLGLSQGPSSYRVAIYNNRETRVGILNSSRYSDAYSPLPTLLNSLSTGGHEVVIVTLDSYHLFSLKYDHFLCELKLIGELPKYDESDNLQKQILFFNDRFNKLKEIVSIYQNSFDDLFRELTFFVMANDDIHYEYFLQNKTHGLVQDRIDEGNKYLKIKQDFTSPDSLLSLAVHCNSTLIGTIEYSTANKKMKLVMQYDPIS